MTNYSYQISNISGNRILWIDTAKAIGIFLVFYGHLIEPLINTDDAVFLQFKFVNSFHMPFFFFVSGFFFKRNLKPLQRVKTLFLRRIVPVFAFAILLLPFWIGKEVIFSSTPNWGIILHKAIQYVKGNPGLDVITWFLVCLFTAEILALFIHFIFKSRIAIVIIGIISLIFGLFICDHIYFVMRVTHIPRNFWYAHESLIALGFYLIGYFLFPIIRDLKVNYIMIAFYTLICFLILLFTYNLNNPYGDFFMSMYNSFHGNFIWFLIDAFSGTFFIIFLSKLIPSKKILLFFGQSTLLLLGLNGIFHHFINNEISVIYSQNINVLLLTAYSVILTAISLLLCYFPIKFLNKYFPQLFGKPFLNGPILSNFENREKNIG